MSTVIQTGWLKDNKGGRFAPKTLSSQIVYPDGESLEDKISNVLDGTLESKKVLITGNLGQITTSKITSSELEYLYGATGNIQEQLDHVHTTFLPVTGGTLAGSTQYPLAISSVINNEASIAYRFNGDETSQWVVGPGAGTADWSKFGFYKNGKGCVASITEDGQIELNSWIKTNGATGWYNATYGGGWYMADNTWIRAYNGKNIYTSGIIQCDGGFTTGGTSYMSGYMDLFAATPFIDFHYNNSSADYTSRIIEATSGRLHITSRLSVGDYANDSYAFSTSSMICNGVVNCYVAEAVEFHTLHSSGYNWSIGGGTGTGDGSKFGIWNSVSGLGACFDTSNNLVLGGNLHAGQSVVASGLTYGGQFNAVFGDYGVMFRNDGSSFYILLSQAGYVSSWRDLFPFIIDIATGKVDIKTDFYCTYWNGGTNTARPVVSSNTDGARVTHMASKVNTSGTYYVNINGQYSTAGSTYTAHNITCTTSDVRLKTNILDTGIEALSVINQMQVRQFDWKDNGIHQKIGFIADELEVIDPALAIGGGWDEDGNMDVKSVNDFYLLGYLTKGIQELSQENQSLREENESLRVDIKAIKKVLGIV